MSLLLEHELSVGDSLYQITAKATALLASSTAWLQVRLSGPLVIKLLVPSQPGIGFRTDPAPPECG